MRGIMFVKSCLFSSFCESNVIFVKVDAINFVKYIFVLVENMRKPASVFNQQVILTYDTLRLTKLIFKVCSPVN